MDDDHGVISLGAAQKGDGVEMGAFGPMIRGLSSSGSRDDLALARLGKKPVLKRNFGFMTILGFSCTILITWEGTLMYVPPREMPVPARLGDC